MPRLKPPALFAAACGIAFAVGAATASAVELSDFKMDFTDTGLDQDGAAGSLRLRAQGGEASLQIRLRDVDANPLYLCAGESESSPLVAQAELEPRGGRLTSDAELDFDPRTKYLTISSPDCNGQHLLEATLDEPTACTPGSRTRLKIYERAELEPGVAPEGSSAELLYHVLPDRNCNFANDADGRPRRKARLSVRVKHATEGETYDVCIDGENEGSLSTNAAGVGRRDFTFNPPKGNGQGNPKRSVIDFDAYASEVEIRTDGICDVDGDEDTAVFFGSLLAPLCEEQDLGSVTLAAPGTPPPATPTGEASLERDAGCARVFEVSVQGLADGDYDVAVGGTVVGQFTVPDGTPAIVFSSDPDSDEELLDFDPSGQLVEVRPQGTLDVALSGVLP